MADPRRNYNDKVTSRGEGINKYTARGRSYSRDNIQEVRSQVVQNNISQVPVVQQSVKKPRIVSVAVGFTKQVVNGTDQSYMKVLHLKAGETLKHALICNKQVDVGTTGGYRDASSSAATHISLAYGYKNTSNLNAGEFIDTQTDTFHIVLGRGVEAGNNVDLLNIVGKDVEGIERHVNRNIEYTFDRDVFFYLCNHTGNAACDLTLIIN